jgi:hypothetical protein
MHVFLELVTQFEYLYTKTIVMDIAISFGKWRGSQLQLRITENSGLFKLHCAIVLPRNIMFVQIPLRYSVTN